MNNINNDLVTMTPFEKDIRDFVLGTRDHTCPYLRYAMQAGKEWHWTEAGEFLAKYYKHHKVKNPYEDPTDAGRDWHCGIHPISKLIGKYEREIFGDLLDD